VLTSNKRHASTVFKDNLNACFSIKDLGPLKYFLGIEVVQGPEWMFLCQWKYTLDVIDEGGPLEAKAAKFPIEENHRLALAA